MSFHGVYLVFKTCFTTLHNGKGSLKISMCDFLSLFQKLPNEENAAYTSVAKTRFNTRVHALINFTSELAVIFFL